jgi:hypothetical protein
MDYIIVNAVRISIGTSQGKTSSQWRFWGNKKGDIYVSSRSMGHIFKISLHKDGNCFAGFTSEFKMRGTEGLHNRSRHFDKWQLDINSPGIAIQVLFPESELRMYEQKDLNGVDWFAPPSINQMFVVTVYTFPDSITEVSFDLGKKMFPIATFETGNRKAIIVGHYQELDLETITWIEEEKKRFNQDCRVPKSEGFRAIVGGHHRTNNRRWFLDMAWQEQDS